MENSWFITDSVVRGHHVCKDRCTPMMDETLYNVCEKKEAGRIVGHVPRNISTLCLVHDQLCRSNSAYRTKKSLKFEENICR